MKYQVGDCVVLSDEKTVCIVAIDEKHKRYTVVNIEDSNDIYDVSENKVCMCIL